MKKRKHHFVKIRYIYIYTAGISKRFGVEPASHKKPCLHGKYWRKELGRALLKRSIDIYALQKSGAKKITKLFYFGRWMEFPSSEKKRNDRIYGIADHYEGRKNVKSVYKYLPQRGLCNTRSVQAIRFINRVS